MRSEFDALTDEYNSNVRKLQRRCLYKKKSKWREQWWALGNSTGYVVRVCLNCNKILDKNKDHCRIFLPNLMINQNE